MTCGEKINCKLLTYFILLYILLHYELHESVIYHVCRKKRITNRINININFSIKKLISHGRRYQLFSFMSGISVIYLQ